MLKTNLGEVTENNINFSPFSTYRPIDFLNLAGIAVIYMLLAMLVLNFFSANGIVSIVWPPSGFALAALLIGGRKYWPGVFIGAFAANLMAGSSAPVSTFIAMGNTLEALLGLWLLTRNSKFDPLLRSSGDYFRLFFLAGFISTCVSALIGPSTLFISGFLKPENFLQNVQYWWMGDALGIILVSPLILIWQQAPADWQIRKRAVEIIVFFGLAFLAGQAVFLDWFPDYVGHVNWGYWMFLFVALAAVRFGLHGAVLITSMTAVQALIGAVMGTGFFATDIADTALTNFWVYIIVLAVVGMAQAAANEERKKQATYDMLTELPNRRLFRDRLDQEILKSHRAEKLLALLFIDLDHFKEVNDTLGHHVGDRLLIAAAKRIKNCIRETDTVARLGGDEFTVIISEINDTHDVERIAMAINTEIRKPYELENVHVHISCSIGIAVYPDDGIVATDLFKFADQAMYSAKDHGRNRFKYFTGAMQESAENRLNLANDLHVALANGQFDVYFQPIKDLNTGEILKAEALLRWHHPEKGLICPIDFIPIAETTGIINEIGDWVLREAAEKAKLYSEHIGKPFQISVNMSPVQFMAKSDFSWLSDFLKELGLSGENLSIEITEGVLLNSRPEVAEILSNFRNDGIKVVIDDFGTGYSSLSYIQKFPVSCLKIDRSFTHNLFTDTSSQILTTAIISMAHALDMEIISEGIETIEQNDFMVNAGCDYAQGYLYSKPVQFDELAQLLC